MSLPTDSNSPFPKAPKHSHQSPPQRRSRTETSSYPYLTAENGRPSQQLGPINPLGVGFPSPSLFAEPVPPPCQLPQLQNQRSTTSTTRESVDANEKSSPIPGYFSRRSQRLNRRRRRIYSGDVDDSETLLVVSRFYGDEICVPEKHVTHNSSAQEQSAHSSASSQLTMSASKHGMLPGLDNYLNNKVESSTTTGNLAARTYNLVATDNHHPEVFVSNRGLSIHDAHDQQEHEEQCFDPDEESLIKAIQDLKLFQDLRITPLMYKQTTEVDSTSRSTTSTPNMDGSSKELLLHDGGPETSFEEIELDSSSESEPSDSDFEVVETTVLQTDVNGCTGVDSCLLGDKASAMRLAE